MPNPQSGGGGTGNGGGGLGNGLISFEYVVQNVMLDPDDERTVHWMGLEAPGEDHWSRQPPPPQFVRETREMRLR